MQENKSKQAPHTLVQKTRMNANARTHFGGYAVADHSKEPVFVASRAVRLLIYKVSPATERLSDKEAQSRQICHREEINLAKLAHQQTNQHRADYSTVNRDTSIPHSRKHCNKVVFFRVWRVGIQVDKHAVINSRAKERADNRYKNDIKNTVFNKSEIARYTAHCVNIRQNDSNGDNHTVPVNIKSENTETAAIRNFHTTEQIGKRHRHISQSFRRSEHQ